MIFVLPLHLYKGFTRLIEVDMVDMDTVERNMYLYTLYTKFYNNNLDLQIKGKVTNVWQPYQVYEQTTKRSCPWLLWIQSKSERK